MGLLEKIKDIEHEMARTQKNKATGQKRSKERRWEELMEFEEQGGEIQFHAPIEWLTLEPFQFACSVLAEYHLGLLKAKLAKLRTELMDGGKGGGGKGEGFDVMKSGDARCALIGFPSVGKSTLLSTLTNTQSAMAAYEFTTLTCIPGVIGE
jgi:ribosome-interacting GTPase 1